MAYFKHDNKRQHLMACASIGICLVQFAAVVELLGPVVSKFTVCDIRDGMAYNIGNNLEVDCRGNITVSLCHCSVTLGEIKSSENISQLSHGRGQLVLRALVMKFVASCLHPGVSQWLLVAYCFVPRVNVGKIAGTGKKWDDQMVDAVSVKYVMI